MKKGEKWAAAALGAVIVVALAVVAVIYFLSAPHLENIDERKTADIGGIHTIRVECAVSDINVTVGGDELVARLHGMALANEEFRARLVLETGIGAGTLSVREERAGIISFGGGESLVMDITVPQGFAGALRVSSSSGHVRAEGLRLAALDATTASGRIEIRDCAEREGSVGDAFIGSSSGEITIDSLAFARVTMNSSSGIIAAKACSAGEFAAQSTSGNIIAEGCEAGGFEAKSTSGSISLRNASTGTLRIATTSGGIDASLDALSAQAQLSSTSGTVLLDLPENLSVKLNVSSVSGSVRSDLPSVESGLPVSIDTTSGSINIR